MASVVLGDTLSQNDGGESWQFPGASPWLLMAFDPMGSGAIPERLPQL